jgi:hypothetical protein
MALILFVYTRTSIRAAKANAQRVRDADTGGEGLSLLAEHRRRHGTGKRVEGTGDGTVVELSRELFGRNKDGAVPKQDEEPARSEEDERLRALMKKGRKNGDGT